MKRIALTLLVLMLLAAGVAAMKTVRAHKAEKADDDPPVSGEQWEYLVVSSPQNNLSPSGNTSMRKEPNGFGREEFVVEQQMDKLGAKGWELVSVTGGPGGPTYFFKRHK